jgi:hypothetical protein
MRDEFHEGATDADLLAALTGSRIALIADNSNIATHSAQSCFATTAMLMARSGQAVHLMAPDVAMVGPQPPLKPGLLVSRLLEAGAHLIPGVEFSAGHSAGEFDLAIALGNSSIPVAARRYLRLNATPWEGRIARADVSAPWQAGAEPLGGLTAAALAATEAFKVPMARLAPFTRNPERMGSVFAGCGDVQFALAPANMRLCSNLGHLDCISGGAITNAILYALARIPDVEGQVRVFEPETPDLTNLNRYMLLLRSNFVLAKAHDLAGMLAHRFSVQPMVTKYGPEMPPAIAALRSNVLVGVDHIPSRWIVQQAHPEWLGIGATTHWSAMASFHQAGLGCARCLHPVDDEAGNTPIPTAAFVSFWAGLLTAAYFLRHLAGEDTAWDEQHVYLTPTRPETPFRAAVPTRMGCPTCGAAGTVHKIVA